MKKTYFALLLGLLLFSFSASAETTDAVLMDEDVQRQDELISEEAVSGDEFFKESNSTKRVEDLKPTCEDPQFYQKIVATIHDYLADKTSTSVIGRRKMALLSSNLRGFEEMSVKDLSAEKHASVLSLVTMLKINDRVPEKNIMICRQVGEREHPLYVVVYPNISSYKVLILDLAVNPGNYDEISFIWP